MARAFGLVKANYVVPVDEKKLIGNAIGGMVAGLDPHSVYLDRAGFKEFNEVVSGKFVGVGIEINMEDGLVKVMTPIEGSPAFRAGIKSGDLITKIDDAFVKGLSMDQAVKRMRGDPSTQVILTIYRKSEDRSFPVTIVREEILTKSIRSKLVEPGYGWIRISQFQERTVEDFVASVDKLFKEDPKMKGLVLDLRNDPGGFLGGAIAISAAFLPKDVTVVSTNGQIQDNKRIFKARIEDYGVRSGGDPLAQLPSVMKSIPLVVLVNEGSASASEIVSGALQDYKRATVMGAQTFGKGSVQTVLPLTDYSAIKITTARYYTPSGRSIQAKGIVPDVMLDETAEGNLYGALRMREADLDKHLSSGQGAEVKDAAREKAREAATKKLEEANAHAKKNEAPKPLPEFGSAEDFQLQQALNHLKGQPVVASKTMTERKVEGQVEDSKAQ